jgi:hypothetical protein
MKMKQPHRVRNACVTCLPLPQAIDSPTVLYGRICLIKAVAKGDLGQQYRKVEKGRGTHFQVKLNSRVELNAVYGNAEGHWYTWFVDGEVVVMGGYATKPHGIEFEAVELLGKDLEGAGKGRVHAG